MPLDLTKPMMVRGSKRKVRFLGVFNERNGFTHAFAVRCDDGTETIWQRKADGTSGGTGIGQIDIINVPERIKRTVWMNVYKDRVSYGHPHKYLADQCAEASRLACVKLEIDCEVGEGL